MPVTLGLDIGSNSIGTAWIDPDAPPGQRITLGVTVFPAGVDESEGKRGDPKNQRRREKRSQRRSLARRAQRKRRLRRLLNERGFLPTNPAHLDVLFGLNPWVLRRDALCRPLTPHELGRVLVHMAQRRGALGIETDTDDPEEGVIKEAIDHLRKAMTDRKAETFGQFMADLMDERRVPLPDRTNGCYHEPIRNRRDHFEFHADRAIVRAEFERIWVCQKALGGDVARLLTDEFRRELDDDSEDRTWRHKGALFGQRRTYWNLGTLGRCDLEPAEHRVPIADMYAQHFRVVETVNNIRVEERGRPPRPLNAEERKAVIRVLKRQKTASAKTIRKELGIDKRSLSKRGLPENAVNLNIERDPDREINTDWFHLAIVHGAFGEERWQGMNDRGRDSVNRAVLKFDPQNEDHENRLRRGAVNWWGLTDEATARLVKAWKSRPRLEKRLNLSRRAIQNLLPYMDEFDSVNNRWPTQIEARQRFAEDGDNDATPLQRARYSLNAPSLTRSDRRYLRKHAEPLPPAPVLANPVVRKAIHEVRRHIIAYWRRFGRKPDRIFVEFARSAKQPGRIRQQTLDTNRSREKTRKGIIDEFGLTALTLNQQRAAVDRVVLCRQQRGICPYSGRTISEQQAARGADVETDHIIPYSRCGDDSLNNRVLVYRESNRGKGNKTPREWLGTGLEEVLQRIEHLKDAKPARENYFRARDSRRKWDNFIREVREEDEWRNSQLTDTAYAARQVIAYVRDALYGGEGDTTRRVFVTKGSYTARLRKDWQLFQHRTPDPDDGTGDGVTASESLARIEKGRGDHRHHAIDAVVIALTAPDIITQLARQAAQAEEYHDRTGYWPSRQPFDPPWGTVQEFRAEVMQAVENLVVSHRPVKRKVVGALHEETAYGPVAKPLPSHRTESAETLFTNRIRADALKPNHLRVPEGWDKLSAKLDDASLSGAGRNDVRRQLAALRDLSPGKSGIVRDRALRDRIRKCLRVHGLDPDAFAAKDVKKLVHDGKLRLPSGVPIKSVVLLRTNTDPVIIDRRVWDAGAKCCTVDSDPRTRRVYIGGNNHHIELLADTKTGRLSGRVVTSFEAAKRIRIDRGHVVDRSDRKGKRFVMSLAEGETVWMSHPKTREPGYFVVFKLDKPHTIHLIRHWDARPAAPRKDTEGNIIPGTGREEIHVTPNNLRQLGPEPGQPPRKVHVSPLGHVQPLERD